MTPQERDLIAELFERMRQQRLSEVDQDARDLIERSIRANPDAAYQLVQSVIVRNMALERANARIRDLEDDLRDIDSEQDRGRSSGGSFLGGLFGGGRRDDDRYDDDDRDDRYDDRRRGRSFGRSDDDDRRRDYPEERIRRSPGFGAPASTSVPSSGTPRDATAASPWSQAGAANPTERGRGGGSFLGTALTTATGVAGGMLLADGIRGLFQGDNAVAGAAEAAKSAGSSIFGDSKSAADSSSKDAEHGITEASDTTSGSDSGGGGLFDSLFGSGDDSGDDDLMDI